MNRRRLPVLLCLFLAATACLVAVSDITPTRADTMPNSWLDKTIVTEKRGDLTVESFGQRVDTWNQCVNVTVEFKYYPWYFTPRPILGERQDCMTPGATGYFQASNRPRQIIQYGTKRVQLINEPMTDANTWTGPMYHVPYTNRIIHLHNTWGGTWGSNGPHTAYLDIIDDWNDTFRVSDYFGEAGNISLERSKGPDYTLEENGTDVQGVSSNGLEISANGKWLHVLLPSRSYILLNLDTHEVKPYADSSQPMYAMRADVSNDGRFVARSYDLQSLKIFDTMRCQPAQGKFESRDCESMELLEGEDSILRKLFPGKEITIGRLNFVGNGNALDVDLQIGSYPNYSHLTYRLKPSGSEPVKYLAMGDSFSSGEGAFDYVEATDMFVSNEEYNVCHLSRKSYPYLLQQNLQADWFRSVACSGSTTDDVATRDPIQFLRSGDTRARTPNLITQRLVDEYARASIPGYIPQTLFVSNNSPSISTISVGGNDVDFAGIIESCIFNGFSIDQICYDSREERESKANEIDEKIPVWSKGFVDIKNSLGGSEPKLYVIGYPKIISSYINDACGLNVPFDPSERINTERLVNYLNTAIKVAADAAGVRYVDVSDAFTRNGDYRLCANESKFAVNGLDMKSKINLCFSAIKSGSPVCPNSFHPNQFGHKLMSETIMSKTANLTQSMPKNSNSTADLVNKRMEFVGDVDITLQNHRITYWKDIAPALITKGEKIQINLPKSPTELPAKAGTTATGTVHSTPRDLGQLPISADGTISGELTLPSDIETGYHRLIISYTDIADNIVERYAYFYAAQSLGDWDGDGIGNAADPCPSVQQSGVDQDADGIDDACDGEYVKSAQTPVPHNETAANSNTENRLSNKPTTEFALKTPTSNPFESSAAVFDNLFSNQHDYDKQTTGIELNSSANMDETQTGQNDSDEAPRMFTSVFVLSGILAVLIASAVAWIIIRRNIG